MRVPVAGLLGNGKPELDWGDLSDGDGERGGGTTNSATREDRPGWPCYLAYCARSRLPLSGIAGGFAS